MKELEFTGADVPAKVRYAKLVDAVRAVAPKAVVDYQEAGVRTKFRPDTGEEYQELGERKVVVANVPDGIEREQVLAVLAAHQPAESDDEERERARERTPEAKILKRLRELEDRVTALEAKKGP